MLTKRPSAQRGRTDLGWLDSHHTFSFGGYFDPKNSQWGPLRVINDDIVSAGKGFGEHPHQDAEIFSYIVEGSLVHQDSIGNRKEVGPNEVQYMSAGHGVEHSEFNGSATERVHFLQVWILPSQKGVEPRYEQKSFSTNSKTDSLCLILSEKGESESIKINQDVKVYASILNPNKSLSYTLDPSRLGWIQMISGEIKVNGTSIRKGDGLAIKEESELSFEGLEKSEFLFFDLVSL